MTGVNRVGEQVVVTGTGNVLHAVTAFLARNQVIAQQLRVEQVTLDDAFVALTGVNDRAAAVGAAFEKGLLTPGDGR